MSFLQSRPGKVILVWLLSLVAAIVCFGLLESSGVVENGAVQLGGAIAGFIVSLLVLNRVWGQEDDLEQRAINAGSDFVYDEVVKALDLRNASPFIDQQMAELTDYYRAKRLGPSNELRAHYATTADGIEWRGSPTHPTSARWEVTGQPGGEAVSHTGFKGQVLKREYLLTVSLGELARGESTALINNVVYKNAFKGSDSEWLETHLEKPTGRLTMIILAPNDMQITSAVGGRKVERDPFERITDQPAVMSDGSVIYWSVEQPQQSDRYALHWQWRARSSAGQQAATQ
jgi:hypothetical protein